MTPEVPPSFFYAGREAVLLTVSCLYRVGVDLSGLLLACFAYRRQGNGQTRYEEGQSRSAFGHGLEAASAPVGESPQLTQACGPDTSARIRHCGQVSCKVRMARARSIIPVSRRSRCGTSSCNRIEDYGPPMKDAMVCHIHEGELRVVQEDKTFTAKKNFVWTCDKAHKRTISVAERLTKASHGILGTKREV